VRAFEGTPYPRRGECRAPEVPTVTANGPSALGPTEESSTPHAGLMLPLSLTQPSTPHLIHRFSGLPDPTGRFPESA